MKKTHIIFAIFAAIVSGTSFAQSSDQCSTSGNGLIKTCCLTFRKTGDVHCCSTVIESGESLGCTVNGQRTQAIESNTEFEVSDGIEARSFQETHDDDICSRPNCPLRLCGWCGP